MGGGGETVELMRGRVAPSFCDYANLLFSPLAGPQLAPFVYTPALAPLFHLYPYISTDTP